MLKEKLEQQAQENPWEVLLSTVIVPVVAVSKETERGAAAWYDLHELGEGYVTIE
jgi:hypothetical protein